MNATLSKLNLNIKFYKGDMYLDPLVYILSVYIRFIQKVYLTTSTDFIIIIIILHEN